MAFQTITQLTEEQIQDLHQLYQSSWWGKQRTVPEIGKMLKHTDLIVGLCEVETRKLVGFARVLTDWVYRAVIWDVIVEPSYQGQGLGKYLFEAIANHPSLQAVELILLICLPEMVPFYQKFGFTNPPVDRVQLMLQVQGDIVMLNDL